MKQAFDLQKTSSLACRHIVHCALAGAATLKVSVPGLGKKVISFKYVIPLPQRYTRIEDIYSNILIEVNSSLTFRAGRNCNHIVWVH
jgi:hypothetical protein